VLAATLAIVINALAALWAIPSIMELVPNAQLDAQSVSVPVSVQAAVWDTSHKVVQVDL